MPPKSEHNQGTGTTLDETFLQDGPDYFRGLLTRSRVDGREIPRSLFDTGKFNPRVALLRMLRLDNSLTFVPS